MANNGATPQAHARLGRAVADARLVLEFVCRRREAVPDAKTIETVTGAGQLLTSSGWSAEKEAEFWLAYNKLTMLARPVTVETLLSSWPMPNGTSNPDEADPDGTAGDGPADSPSSVLRRATDWLHGVWQRVRRPRRVRIGRAAQRYRQWALVWLVAVVVLQVYWGIGTEVVSDLAKDIAALQDATAGSAGKDVHITANLALLQVTTFGFGESGLGDSPSQAVVLRYYLELQTFLNNAVLGYILPILLGTLGASVYIMRRVAEEVEQFTFSNAREVQYRLRFYLGGIAGLMVGWFLQPGAAGGAGDVLSGTAIVTSISPLALSFLAGYSVELLFAAMDRLVDTFTGGTSSPAAEAPPHRVATSTSASGPSPRAVEGGN